MIKALIIVAALGQIQPPPCFDCVHVTAPGFGAKATAQINLTIDIQSELFADVKTRQLFRGIYQLTVLERGTGFPEARTTKFAALVVDDYGVMHHDRPVIMFAGDGRIQIQANQAIAFYQYPSGMRDKEVVAAVRRRDPIPMLRVALVTPKGAK